MLDRTFYESEHCWLFFRNRALVLPKDSQFKDASFLVSKYGGCMHGYDYYEDPKKCQDYLDMVSQAIEAGKLEDYFR